MQVVACTRCSTLRHIEGTVIKKRTRQKRAIVLQPQARTVKAMVKVVNVVPSACGVVVKLRESGQLKTSCKASKRRYHPKAVEQLVPDQQGTKVVLQPTWQKFTKLPFKV